MLVLSYSLFPKKGIAAYYSPKKILSKDTQGDLFFSKILPPFIYPRPILKSENSIYARPICVFALENTKSSLWHLCEQ
jgi:hypothetical protein